MTFKAFFRVRRQQRLQRRADRAMCRIFGAAWEVNVSAICDLLSSPAPVYVTDAGTLQRVVRSTVAEALAGSAAAGGQAIDPFPADLIYEAEEPEESFPVEPVAEVESPRETSISEERANGGVDAVPARLDMSNDDRRRAFVRSFLDEQKAARGGIPTSLRS